MCAVVGNPCGELKYQDAATGLLQAPRKVPNGVVIVVVVVELKNCAWADAVAGLDIDNVHGRRIDLLFFVPVNWLLLLTTAVNGAGGGGGATGLPPLPPIAPYLPFTANSNGTNSSGSAKIESDLCKPEQSF